MDSIASPPAKVDKKINSALAKASKKTGVGFDYLIKTATRESSLQPSAKSRTSSAVGLFQFIESTWLETLKEDGHKLGLGKYADLIKKADGNYTVENARVRAKVLGLRQDPEISALVAGAYAQKNESFLANKLGREPKSGELYIAHFLGPKDAVRLIRLSELKPEANADLFFSEAAATNKPIFYQGKEPRNIAQVYHLLMRDYGQTSKTVPALSINSDGWKAKIVKTVEPLVKKANFKARNQEAPIGSVGVWGNITSNEKSQTRKQNNVGDITKIYRQRDEKPPSTYDTKK